MAKNFLLTRTYDEKCLKTIGLESATKTNLVIISWLSNLGSMSQCHSEPNKFKMEYLLPLPRENTFDGPLSPLEACRFPSSRLLRELGLCLLPDHFPCNPLILQSSSSFISLHSFAFLLWKDSSSLSKHPLLDYHNFLTALPSSKLPFSSSLLCTLLPHSPFKSASLILSLPQP